MAFPPIYCGQNIILKDRKSSLAIAPYSKSAALLVIKLSKSYSQETGYLMFKKQHFLMQKVSKYEHLKAFECRFNS